MDRILSQVFDKTSISNNKSFKTEEIEKLENEINNMTFEIKEKKNNIKYTDDGIPTIESQIEELKLKDEEMEIKHKENEEKRYKREMTQRVKCLALNKMGKHFMTNTLNMNIKDRKKLQEIMWSYNDIDHKKIIEEFNELVCEELDNVNELDYSRLPVYDI